MNFLILHTDEIEQSSVGVRLAHGGVEVGGIAVCRSYAVPSAQKINASRAGKSRAHTPHYARARALTHRTDTRIFPGR